MDKLRLTFLGGMAIDIENIPVVDFKLRKGQALLCYLAVTGRSHSRSALAGLLWRDMLEEKARMNLRKTLAKMRLVFGPYLHITNDDIGLNLDSSCWLDVTEFEQVISEVNLKPPLSPKNYEQLLQAMELYRGDFMEGFYLRNAPAFEEWILGQRARLRESALQVLNVLAEYAAQHSDYPAGITYARRLLKIEPWREEAHRQLMTLLARDGQRSAAIAQYKLCCQLLLEELGVEPSAETAALCKEIQANTFRATQIIDPQPIISETKPPLEKLSGKKGTFLSLNQLPLSPLQTYHKQTIASLSDTYYQIDRRFVKLTLLVDQGLDVQGMRFIVDSNQRQYDNLQELLEDIEEQAIVILGDPGGGKTTLLRRLQFDLARAELEDGQDHTVFFVPLNSYRAFHAGKDVSEPLHWLAEAWTKRYPELPDFRTLFCQGKLYLLLDGLNEIPHQDKADYRRQISHWRQFLQETRRYGNRVIFSCRRLDYSAPLSSPAVPVRQVRVEPLSPAQMETFLHTYLSKQGDMVWQRLQRDRQQLSLFSNPFFLRLLVDQIGGQGELPAGQAALLTGFVRRALHREVTEQTHHFFQPDAMLSEGDYEQVLHDTWLTPYQLPWEGALFNQLEQLAFAMQDSRDSAEAAQVRIQEREALQYLDQPQARNIIQAGIQLNILVKEVSTRELSFTHQLIQEYFAARLLAKTPDPTKVAVLWRADEIRPSLTETVAGLEKGEPLPAASTTGWEETMMLASAMAQNQAAFVRDLMPVNLPLAAHCAAVSEVRLPELLIKEIQQALISRIEMPQTDLRACIAAANSLGVLGDPRFDRYTGPYGPYLRPPVAFIPGGSYPMGSDDHPGFEDVLAANWAESEKPFHTVGVAAYEMGIFPITNAEYRLFWEGGGYEDERWWPTEAARTWLREGGHEAQRQEGRDVRRSWQSLTEEQLKSRPAPPEAIEHWLWGRNASDEEFEAWLIEEYPGGVLYRQPRHWDESYFNQPTQPVVGISWFEALAYCTWLSAQTGAMFDLPTEVEWEAAARGANGRIYAFGNTFAPAQCNTFETHIRGTTPVGVFPTGRTPEGVFDLSGNVWEWTTTLWGKKIETPDFPYPYEVGDGRENREEAEMRRVIRGGSWDDGQDIARAAARSNYIPGGRLAYLGFRVVLRCPFISAKL